MVWLDQIIRQLLSVLFVSFLVDVALDRFGFVIFIFRFDMTSSQRNIFGLVPFNLLPWFGLVWFDVVTFAAVEIPFKDLVNLCSEGDVVI